MNIKKSTRFALYSLIALAREAPANLSVAEIAGMFQVSEHHLSKIMQTLTRSGLVDGMRGASGGYILARDPKSITVMDIIRLFEPGYFNDECQLKVDNQTCSRAHSCCSLRNLFNEISLQAAATFSAVTVDSLARQEAGTTSATRLRSRELGV